MIRRLIILLLIVGCVYAREYIAIIDFEGIGVTDDEAKILTQRLTSEMIALEVYQIIERKEMKRLLDEQKFQYSGCVDLKCAVEIGKMVGAKYMVVGSVSKLGNSYSIDSRMISIESSEAYISASFVHKGEIDKLLTDGISSISRQLCELEDNPKYDAHNFNTETTLSKSKVNGCEVEFIEYDKPPKAIVPIRPIYPKTESANGIEGTVYIQFFIDREGNVSEACVEKSLPENIPQLQEQALLAVKKSKWNPAIKDKINIGTWQVVPVQFELK